MKFMFYYCLIKLTYLNKTWLINLYNFENRNNINFKLMSLGVKYWKYWNIIDNFNISYIKISIDFFFKYR